MKPSCSTHFFFQRLAPEPIVFFGCFFALLAVVNGHAYGQDMTFTLEDVGGAPAEGPPSEALANALRLYQQERYLEAAVQFQRVVGGET
ncbi:MAG: hypothetical protein RMJ84_02915, partial [Sandaracinaceae bacterium]|nr:hypothetical protein [Sandaracinaceae bacterium]